MSKKKDWAGQKFHKLTFLNISNNKSGNKYLWNVLCECGNITKVIPYNIVSGNTTSCGECNKPQQSKDWTNIKYQSLTFIKPYKKNKNDQIIWEALCDCGKIIYTLPSNNAKSCGCLAKPDSRKRCSILGKSGRKFSPEISTARQVWSRYKKDGDISFELFYELSQLPCKYCGSQPSNEYTLKKYHNNIMTENYNGLFIYNGLDRIDSKKGHDSDNVVPCCPSCNFAKLHKTTNEFLLHIKKIYEYNFK